MQHTFVTARCVITALIALIVMFAGTVGAFAALDAVFANADQPNKVCLGDDMRGFTCTNVSPDELKTRAVALGDVNGDTHLDAVFAINDRPNKVCLGDGIGGFTCANVSPDALTTRAVALGDVNGDTHLDAVFGSSRNQVCLGDGNGGFTCADVSPDVPGKGGVALGDINGDTHLDAVFGSPRNGVCLGDGAGGFTCADVIPDTANAQAVALGDVNGDTHLDAVFAKYAQPSRVCLGDGGGGFTCANVSEDALDARSNSKGMALGDVNGDGHLDVIFANENQPNRICLGGGNGGFTCASVSTDNRDTGQTQNVALGDVNGDGHLDAVFANFIYRNRVCLGDGGGGFKCENVSGEAFGSFGVALGKLKAQAPPKTQAPRAVFRIDKKGNIGIGSGNQAPDSKFELNVGSIAIQVDNADNKLRFRDPHDNMYSVGIDRDDSGNFKINRGGNLGANNDFVIRSIDGNVGIGTHDPQGALDVKGDVYVDGRLVHSSDARLKKDVSVLDDVLIRLSKIHGVSFRWKDKEKDDEMGKQIGIIAQEVEAVFPEVIITTRKGEKFVSYDQLIAPLIEAVNLQQQMIKRQDSILSQQQKEIEYLTEMMEKVVTKIHAVDKDINLIKNVIPVISREAQHLQPVTLIRE